MKPQTIDVLAHLKRHGSIRPREAQREYGCTRLAARVLELRQEGYAIETHYICQRGRRGAVRFAEYRLK